MNLDFSVFNNNKFIFNEETHSYTLNGKKMTSVTQWISQFHPHFDEEYWSNRKALERGISKEELLLEWKAKNDKSNVLGKAVHLYMEEKFKGIPITPIVDEEVKLRINKFEKLYLNRLQNFKSIAQELRVFSEELGVAGTIDGLFINDDKLWIIDYKSNGKFVRDKDKNFQKMLEPFDDLWDNQENAYSLQLSMYDLLLELKGINVYDKALIWIPPGEEEAKIYRAKDLKDKIRKYFMDKGIYIKKEKIDVEFNI